MPTTVDGLIKLADSIEELSNPRDTYILFIDMCDSTEFKQSCIQADVPDSIWIVRQYVFLTRCAKIIKNYEGQITKTIGDEVMATFLPDKDPIDIIRCVLEIFASFENIKAYNKGKYIIQLKASIDYGESYNGNVLDIDVFDPIGTCVDRCARISKYATKKGITISKDYFDLISSKISTLGLRISPLRENLKGLGEIDFYLVDMP
jgi:class 3 adenylate cyclase